MSKSQFLIKYRQKLSDTYFWAKDKVKLDNFMKSVSTTLEGTDSLWDFHGDAVVAAWKEMGGKGKPTLKALRNLPDVEPTPIPDDVA